MRRTLRAIACLLSLGLAAQAQHLSATGAPPSPATDTVNVTLGNSAVALYGPWRFHVGDDPAWAQAGFNDAQWGNVDLRSPDAPADPDLGTGSDVPGWTAQGYPEYSGFAWYRLRVNVTGAPRALSLKMPQDVDDAYQVFVNGRQIGSFGSFRQHGVSAYAGQPRGFRLPKDLRSGPMVIAIRMWMDSASRFETPDAGGLHGPPVLGLSPRIAADVRLDWDFVTHGIGSGFLEGLVLLLALGVALTLYWLQHEETSYLWLGAVALATLLANLILQLSNYTTLIPQTPAVLLRDVLLSPLRIGLWVLFWASWFCLKGKWLRHLVWELVLILAVATLMMRPPLHGQVVPLHAAVYLHPLLLWTKLALGVLLLVIAVWGIRKHGVEGWLALPALLLAIAANYQVELRQVHIPISYHALGFRVTLGQVSTMLSVLLVTLMLSRRFLHAQRRKAQWQVEVEQARELQRLIIPSKLPQMPGLAIQGEYRPSLEVSGDFFQIIPDHATGSVLVVVGDVTGKGLRAGMLVALIVGALDTAARENNDPAHLLNQLNERLCERGGSATATCLVMKITADGLVSIANAGHLPPYLNGVELDMEGALPMGTLPDADYSTLQFELKDRDTLMLMTDGIVEAQDKKGDLFGFARISEMIASGASAQDLANAAEGFGQEDDILVLRVERTVAQTAFASAAA